jgi:hypothetical protein
MGIPYLVERWSQDDFDVLEDRHHRRPLLHGASRTAGPPLDVGERPRSGHGVTRAAHGYEPTREAAMAAFAKS